jgi:hypothetical protein
MNAHDRRLLRNALMEAEVPPRRGLPDGWRIFDYGEAGIHPAGIGLIPPTGQSVYGFPLPWSGPGKMPAGLGLCRILATAEHDRRFGSPGERVVLATGPLVGPTMRRLSLPGSLEGRGWPQRCARSMIAAAWALHRGEAP